MSAAALASIRGRGRNDQLRTGAQNNPALERKIPVLEVLDVAAHPLLDVGTGARFATETADLCQPGDAWLYECPHVIVRHQLRELIVMFDEMRARADDAHLAAQHVPELRDFVEAQFTEPFAERINALVALGRLARDVAVVRMHGAELQDRETAVLQTGARLHMKERPG